MINSGREWDWMDNTTNKMNKVHIDVCLDMVNHPFIELTEDEKIPNLWHHKQIKDKFYLTANGFKLKKN